MQVNKLEQVPFLPCILFPRFVFNCFHGASLPTPNSKFPNIPLARSRSIWKEKWSQFKAGCLSFLHLINSGTLRNNNQYFHNISTVDTICWWFKLTRGLNEGFFIDEVSWYFKYCFSFTNEVETRISGSLRKKMNVFYMSLTLLSLYFFY